MTFAQRNNCTNTGVPRNAQTNIQALPLITGFGDNRMMASSTPNTRPMIIDKMVSTMVTPTPLTIGGAKIHSPMSDQPQFGLVRRLCSIIAPSTATTAAPTQRPGCRTGTATMGGFVSRLGFPLGSLSAHWSTASPRR